MPPPGKNFVQSSAGDGTTASDQYLHGLGLVSILLCAVISLFTVALDQTITSTILTVVSTEFNSFTKVGWLTSAFMLPLACLAPSYGKVSIAIGRKWTLAGGLVIFEIGSLICALANSMDMLIGGRVIQGVGGGAVQAMVVVIISESVPIDKRALAMALIGITFSVASVCGPFVGGAFATDVTWRWCFYVNLPLGAVALALLLLFFHPPTPTGSLRAKLAKIDYLGTFFIAAGLVLVLLAMTFGGNEYAWSSPAVIAMFVLGGVLLAVFVVYNFWVSPNPMILKEFVAVPQIVASALVAAFVFACFLGLVNYLAIYFQVIFHDSAWQSGVRMLPMVVSVSLASAFNGVFISLTYRIKLSSLATGILCPIGAGILLLLGRDTTTSAKIGLLIPVGVSIGLMFQSTLLSAQREAPGHIPGSMILVTVFINFIRSIGGIIGTVSSQLMLSSRGSIYLNAAIANHPEMASLFENVAIKSLLQSPEAIWHLPDAARNLVLDEFMKALKDVFYLNLAFAILACIASFFTTNKRIPKSSEITNDNEDASASQDTHSKESSEDLGPVPAETKSESEPQLHSK